MEAAAWWPVGIIPAGARGSTPPHIHRNGEDMSMIRGLVKGAVVAKVIQVAQRELSKPENQRKIKDAVSKLAAKRR
jgi:hypothetical protein